MAFFVYRDANGNIRYGMDATGAQNQASGSSYKFKYNGNNVPVFTTNHWLNPSEDSQTNTYFNTLISELDNVVDGEYWANLSKDKKRAIIESNYLTDEIKNLGNLGGFAVGKDYSVDIESLLDDLSELSGIDSTFDAKLPEASAYIDSSEDLYKDVDAALSSDYANAYGRIDSAIAGLNAEAEQARRSYEDQLNTNADYYNRQASGLLSNQYLANAQTYDALQSDMRKSRQNALEAGASAGIRLAGNVNALLSAQNKQSQTAMDTSNALAEMLLQQRNAAAGIRSDYRNYMSDVNSRKTGYALERTSLDTQRRNERETRVADRRAAQQSDYDRDMSNYSNQLSNWENQWSTISDTNPFKNPYQTYLKNKNNINY